MAAIFAVVAIRSYMALAQEFEWKSAWYWGLLAVVALALGKTCGGILADRFGLGRTAAATLGLAAVLYCFSALPVPGVAAVFLFNMTMPMTMWLAAKAFPGAKGMAFGALAFSLFIGYVPIGMGIGSWTAGAIACSAVSLASMVLLLLVVGPKGRRPCRKD